MSEENEEFPGDTPPRSSKSPTWVGKLVRAKDEQIEAIRELADDKASFLEALNAASAAERERMSKSLYEISEQRASDMQKALDGKDITIKRLWIANVIQILIIAALAGVTVTGKLPFIGDLGLDAADKVSEKAFPQD